MKDEEAVRALAALANPHRIALFRTLVRAGQEGMSAGDLARGAGLAPSNLTFHLKELERAGLIRSWREGRFIRSALSVSAMRDLIAFLTDDCCAGRPDMCGAVGSSSSTESECCPPPRAMKG